MKLQELRRRLATYRWAESLNDPFTPQFRVLLDDAESAFLLTFEAALQFLRADFTMRRGAGGFGTWFKTAPQNDVAVRALRTLRHLEAHVEARLPHSEIRVQVEGGRDPSRPFLEREWRLPELTVADLSKLERPQLTREDLAEWNAIATTRSAAAIFEHGLRQVSLATKPQSSS